MYPFDEELEQLKNSFLSLTKELAALDADIDWYDRFDLAGMHATRLHQQRELEAVQCALGRIIGRKATLARQREAAAREAEAGGLLRRLSSAYAVAKRMVADLDAEIADVEAQCKPYLADVGRLTAALATGEQAIAKYRTFDRLRAEAVRAGKRAEAETLRMALDPLQAKKDKLDARLASNRAELDRQIDRCKIAARERSLVHYYQGRLGNARTPAERATIHAEADRILGNRKLGAVLRRADNELADAEREIAKVREEMALQIRWACMDVRTVYLDGSNLCNAKKRFIGLSPLLMLAELLAQSRRVLVCFDYDIGRKLGMRFADIRARFPAGVKVEFADRGVSADRHLLMAASDDHHACVISDDRFTDHTMLPVMQEKRVLRPRFQFGLLHVDQLDVHMRFEDPDGKAVA